MKNKWINLFIRIWSALLGAFILAPKQAYAFTKLKNGFEIITTSYLLPISQAAAGTAFIYYILISYFKPEEKRKAGEVLVLLVFSAVGVEVINKIMQSFS